MAYIFGEQYSRDRLMKYVGDISQIAGAREAVLTQGRGENVRIIDLATGQLYLRIVPSRGMDITHASFQGIPISFISKTGITAPAHYEAEGFGFMRSFTAGMLTTCGLSSMGMPSTDGEDSFGLHGRISNIPAEDVGIIQEWVGDEYQIRLRGKMRESAILKENLCLTREISTSLGSTSFTVRDSIENCGFKKTPLMLIYHINIGFPIVSEDAAFFGPKSSVTPRDADAQEGLENYNYIVKPYPNAKEQMFFHDFADKSDQIKVCIYNKRLETGVCVTYDPKELPYFGEWKMMGEGDYTVAFEPGTWLPLGRAEAKKRNELLYLEPGERKMTGFTLEVFQGKDKLMELMKNRGE